MESDPGEVLAYLVRKHKVCCYCNSSLVLQKSVWVTIACITSGRSWWADTVWCARCWDRCARLVRLVTGAYAVRLTYVDARLGMHDD